MMAQHAVCEVSAQPFGDAGGSGFNAGFKPCNGLLRSGKRGKQWMCVIGIFGCSLGRSLLGGWASSSVSHTGRNQKSSSSSWSIDI